MLSDISRIYFSALVYKTLSAIATLYSSMFFLTRFSDGLFIPFWLCLFIKDLIFIFLCISFLIFHALTQLLQCIENIGYPFFWWNLLLLFSFLSNQENLYMIPYDSDLFHYIYNTINKQNRRQTFIGYKLFWYLFLS